MAENKTKKLKVDAGKAKEEEENQESQEAQEELDPEFLKHKEELDRIQEQLDKLDKEADEKRNAVDREYGKKQIPIFKNRNKILTNIPNFWLKTLENSNRNFFTETEKKLFAHLKDLEVVDATDGKGFRIVFTFEPNEWFENTQLWKEYNASESEDEQRKITFSPIKWKPGKDLEKKAEESAEEDMKKRKLIQLDPADGFFLWYTMDEQDDTLSDFIHDDVYPNCVRFYQHADLSDEEISGFDEEGDEENEENAENEENEG